MERERLEKTAHETLVSSPIIRYRFNIVSNRARDPISLLIVHILLFIQGLGHWYYVTQSIVLRLTGTNQEQAKQLRIE